MATLFPASPRKHSAAAAIKGIVFTVKGAFVYVNLEDSQRCYFELPGDYDIRVGDEVSGNPRSLGSEKILNENKKEMVDVYAQDPTQFTAQLCQRSRK